MSDYGTLRDELVTVLLERGPIGAPVQEAFRAVPRHLFLPELAPEAAYRDEAIVTKRDDDGRPTSSSSQPAIMATMLDQLDVRPGHRVLEIGAGTGYNAALLSHLGAEVVTVDLDDDVVAAAREHLRAAGYPDVRVVCADGAEGFARGAPYDRVIATVGVWELEPAWLEQLVAGGRIVVPLDLRGVQVSAAFERSHDEGFGVQELAVQEFGVQEFDAEGVWRSVDVEPCGFMRMRGVAAGPEEVRTWAGDLTLFLPEPREVADPVLALGEPAAEVVTGVEATAWGYSIGLSLWLAVHEARWCTLSESGGRLTRPPVDARGFRTTAGIAERDGYALLAKGMAVLGYGPGGARLAEELAAHVRAWDEAGQPLTEGLGIAVHLGQAPDAGLVIPKRHTTLVVSYD